MVIIRAHWENLAKNRMGFSFLFLFDSSTPVLLRCDLMEMLHFMETPLFEYCMTVLSHRQEKRWVLAGQKIFRNNTAKPKSLLLLIIIFKKSQNN